MSNPRTIKNILTTEEKNAYNQSFSGIGYNCNYNYVIMEIFFNSNREKVITVNYFHLGPKTWDQNSFVITKNSL